MKELKPKLFSVMKNYSKEQFIKDVIAGIIVAIIALPLSIALALASGVTPEKGIYTAIIAGFVISFLGGSRVQIAGPTAAFATIVAGIVARSGMDGLAIATVMAGIIMILMAVFKFGNLIKFIPYTITVGFTAGIAVTIVIGQIKDFLGLTIISEEPLIETADKLKGIIGFIGTTKPEAVIVGLVSLAVLILWPLLPGFFKKIPASLIAVFAGIAMVSGFGIKADTIGDLYEISGALPSFSFPELSIETVTAVIPDAFTIAILASIESLLSCVVADGMINDKHSSNAELLAQGAGNIASALFGGIPATGAIARTAANIKNGGRTPIAGIVHSVVLLLILIILMPYAALIPMPTIAAILFMVAFNMAGIGKCVSIIKNSPKSDIFVLILTFILTVVFDLVIAIAAGLILTAVLFVKRMSDVTEVREWTKDSEDNYAKIPENTKVCEFKGPLFFGAANIIEQIEVPSDSISVMILRMSEVSAIDATAMKNLNELADKCEKQNIRLILSHVNKQPYSVMKKSGFVNKVGEENFFEHIKDALAVADTAEEKAEETEAEQIQTL